MTLQAIKIGKETHHAFTTRFFSCGGEDFEILGTREGKTEKLADSVHYIKRLATGEKFERTHRKIVEAILKEQPTGDRWGRVKAETTQQTKIILGWHEE